MKHHKDIQHLKIALEMNLNTEPHLIATDDGTLIEFDKDKITIRTDKETRQVSQTKFWDFVINKLESFWNFKKTDLDKVS